jgi:hypothetical protein
MSGRAQYRLRKRGRLGRRWLNSLGRFGATGAFVGSSQYPRTCGDAAVSTSCSVVQRKELENAIRLGAAGGWSIAVDACAVWCLGRGEGMPKRSLALRSPLILILYLA